MKYTWKIEVGEWTLTGYNYAQTYENGTDEVKEVSDIWNLNDFKNWWWDSSGCNIEETKNALNYHESNNLDYKWRFTAINEDGEKLTELEFWENDLMKELIDRYTSEA